MRRFLVVAVLLIAGCGLLAGCGTENPVGTRVRTEDAPKGQALTLTSPLGTARVVVGDPVQTVDKEQANDLKKHRAPAGGALVPVSWDWSFYSGGTFNILGALDHPATISLIAGGRSFPLDTIKKSFGWGQPQYIAVPTTKGLSVGLSYDGLTQTVDVKTGTRHAGVAAPIYDLKPRSIDCSRGWKISHSVDAPMECSLGVAVVPWAGSWAAPGREFVVVSADLRPYPFRLQRDGGFANYDVRGIADHSALDGTAPRTPLQRDPSVEYRASGTLVFDVPTGSHTLDLRLDYTLQKQGQDGGGTYPLSLDVALAKTVPLS